MDSKAFGPIEPGPEVAGRMALQVAPDAATVGCFVMTHGAQHAWAALNEHLHEGHGGLFWIGGAAGCGKTHFLNYVIALNSRAGALSAEPARHLTIAAEVIDHANAAEVDRRLVDLIGHELTGDSKVVSLWRRIGGMEALPIVLDNARRQGIRSVTAVIDFSANDAEPAGSCLASIAQMAASLKHPKLTLIAAGRGDAPRVARAFDVGPVDEERIVVAIGRARRLDDAVSRTTIDAYRGIEIGSFEPGRIFPFHPGAVSVLGAFAKGEAIAPIAVVARDAILRWLAAKSFQRLIFPADLIDSDERRRIVEQRLGQGGMAALGLAYSAADSSRDVAAARQMVDTLMLYELAGSAPPLIADELGPQTPALAGETHDAASRADEILTELAVRSHGVIIFDAQTRAARFDRKAAGTPEVAAFNAAIPLIRCFDSALMPAREARELKTKLRRLGDAIANALEEACRNRELIVTAMREADASLSPAQEKMFDDFIALAESGARALINVGADPERRELAMRVVAGYEAIAALAEAVPRLRAMREYLNATGLHAVLEDNPAHDRELSALETECQLLLLAVSPAALSNSPRNFDALEARFQKFKWTYVQYHRTAHERWRAEMERVAGIVGDVRRRLDALRRLNSIVALGAPEGTELDEEMAAMDRRIARCDLEGPLAPEITPRCPQCGYALGTESPGDSLDNLFARAGRAVQAKFARLSQYAIKRLIQRHDGDHMLEGFLKITQAAQTEALAGVIEDDLARYLSHLLDENAAVEQAPRRVPVQPLKPGRPRRRGTARSDRNAKSLPDNGKD